MRAGAGMLAGNPRGCLPLRILKGGQESSREVFLASFFLLIIRADSRRLAGKFFPRQSICRDWDFVVFR